jgi:K+-transporting ATPase ATPase B chain
LDRRGRRLPSSELAELEDHTERIAQSGGTPLVVAVKDPSGEGRVLGVVHLKDIVKEGLTAVRRTARDGHPHRDGHRRQPAHRGRDRTEAGVDDFLAEATPEQKLASSARSRRAATSSR